MPICYLLFYIEIKIAGWRQDYIIMYVNLNYFDSEDFILPSDILINPFCLKCDLVRLSLLIVCFIFFLFFSACDSHSGGAVDTVSLFISQVSRPHQTQLLLQISAHGLKKKRDMSYLLAVYQNEENASAVHMCGFLHMHVNPSNDLHTDNKYTDNLALH